MKTRDFILLTAFAIGISVFGYGLKQSMDQYQQNIVAQVQAHP